MKLIIPKLKLNSSVDQFLRQAGYAYIKSYHTEKGSYVKRLGSGHYPRLHMYSKESSENLIFDLHLDQKQPSYKGSHAHNAEYDGPIIEGEINRLKQLTLF